MPKLIGKVMETMRCGDHVLCRGFEVRLAAPEIANGTVSMGRPGRLGDRYEPGDYVTVDPIKGLGARDLHAIAAGPIMEPLRLYLPAGKISETEYQERLRLDYERCGIGGEGQ